ncbi:DNA helicase UvrD [Candidatus Pacearchaeota archaeon]|nr:DNA helicase UvrD [Candidatus Pacearchaeota archaeon]MBD3283626.1 DNA helicase UvrD [Candidatus Pacearchaeota archaeon]
MEEQEKEIIADLHIHSRFSRACSKDLNIANLVKWAKIKGLDLLGTGDFTHPEWLRELKNLKQENGILWYDDGERFPFILSSEISLMYTQNSKGRKVHLVYLAPSFEVVDKINEWLDSIGRRDYDGRPIFNISCRDFAAKMEEIDGMIEIIPAHIWTPWFGIFGSMSGFDSLEEAFGDRVGRINSIETGISSDPAMNWKIKNLENKSIVSFSDSHSFWPWRLGREATIFVLKEGEELSYDLILNQIRGNSFKATIETDPAYGKYHFDGHSVCGFSCSPDETEKFNGICPVCGNSLTVGVDNRVLKLSKKSSSDYKNKKDYYTLLPLHEIISLGLGFGMNSKACWNIYNKLIKNFKNEFNVLLKASRENLMNVLEDSNLTDLILKNREGKIKVKPGYDGVYGKALLDKHEPDIKKTSEVQKKLF